MKNQRYIGDAVAQLRRDNHLPERVLSNLSDDDIEAVALSVFNICQEIALARQVDVTVDLEEDVIARLMEAAHKRDITLNELIEERLEAVIAEEDFAERFYRLRNGAEAMAWLSLTDDDRNHWRKIAAKEPFTF